MKDGKFVITFVCTGNTCRSPMAEGLFKKSLPEDFENMVVQSRGIAANECEPASANAISVMQGYGIDISGHKATALTETDLNTTDLFVCMTDGHSNILTKCGISTEKITVLNVSDPFGGSFYDYRKCAEQINRSFGRLYELIREKM